MKTCPKCGITKNVSDFYSHIGHSSGLSSSCKECIKKYLNSRYLIIRDDPKYKKRVKDYGRKWQERNKENRRIKIQNNHKSQRQICIEHYGRSCACCGESTYEFLSIDHIDGGGGKHRKQTNGHTQRWLIKNNFPPGFRILCHNCNQALGHYGYCPHKIAKTKVALVGAA